VVQRVSISVPDDLHERLQALKGRFSVSGVCQEALERKLELLELQEQGGENMQAIVERLKKEKRQYDQKYESDGYEAGLCEAREMEYGTLVGLVRHGLASWPDLLEDFLKEAGADDPEFNADVYVTGWLKGVKAFWKEVRSKL